VALRQRGSGSADQRTRPGRPSQPTGRHRRPGSAAVGVNQR
jgi:hypothetical protein